MSTETIFFSYSRDDSEFVLNLAKNLRIAGASIWLDQLDIKPGSRWDSSIEKALKSSNTLLVILSKTSVGSTNVLDEVSFALEEKKKVVPVLLEECDIPFRLRRLQYADFIGDHKKGITTLIQALELDQNVASKLADVTTDISVSKEEIEEGKRIKRELDAKKKQGNEKPEEKVEPVEEKKENQAKPEKLQEDNNKDNDLPVKKSKSKAPIFILIGIVAVAAAALYYFKDDIFKNQEQIDWDLANAKDEIAAYQDFHKLYTTGKYSQSAKDSIDNKNNREDDKAWLSVMENPTLENYTVYRDNENLEVQKYKERAQDSINIMTSRAEQMAGDTDKDNLAFKVATDGNSVTSYLGYYSNQDVLGNHKAEALEKIDEVGTLGWLYAGTASGNEVTQKRVFEVKWRRDGEFTKKGIPKEGDIVKSLKSVYTYRSFSNNSVNNATRNPTTIKSGKDAFVKDAVQVGGAVFVQIRY